MTTLQGLHIDKIVSSETKISRSIWCDYPESVRGTFDSNQYIISKFGELSKLREGSYIIHGNIITKILSGKFDKRRDAYVFSTKVGTSDGSDLVPVILSNQILELLGFKVQNEFYVHQKTPHKSVRILDNNKFSLDNREIEFLHDLQISANWDFNE